MIMQGNKIGALGYIMDNFETMKQEALLGLQMEMDGVSKLSEHDKNEWYLKVKPFPFFMSSIGW